MTMPLRRSDLSRISLARMLIFVLLTAACGRIFTTKIGTIQRDPRAFDGKTVTVSGTVTESANVLVMRYYIVRDDTGEIHVITEGAVPQKGEKVRVTGTVTQAFSLGDSSLLVLKEARR